MPDGAAKFDIAITKLNVNLGRGAKEFEKWGIHATTAGAAMYEIADRMKATEDPAVRAAMAVDLMGRGGASMVPFLERGAAALKAIADTKPAWSVEDMKDIAAAHQNIEETQNRITLAIGKGIALFGGFFSDLGKISTGPTAMKGAAKEEAHQWMQAFLAKIKAEDQAKFDAEDAAEAAEKKAKSEKDAADSQRDARDSARERADAEREAAEHARKTYEMNKQYASLRRQERDLIGGGMKIDQETPSIADLAGRGFSSRLDKFYGRGGRGDLGAGDGPFAKAAQDYELAQKQQLWDIIHGNAKFDKSGALIGGQAFEDKQRMISAHNLLSGAGLDTPAMKLAEMNDKLNGIYDQIVELGRIAGETGIEIKSN